MPLIKCPECGNTVSDQAKACVHCGFPLRKEDLIRENERLELNTAPKSINFPKIKKYIVPGIVVFIILFFVIFFSFIKCTESGCYKLRKMNSRFCENHTCCVVGCYEEVSVSPYCPKHYRLSLLVEQDREEERKQESVKTWELHIYDIELETNSVATVCTGKVRNSSDYTITFLKVKGSFYGSYSVVDTDWTYVVGSEGLAPGESSTFRLSVPKNSTIKDCDVVIYDYTVK